MRSIPVDVLSLKLPLEEPAPTSRTPREIRVGGRILKITPVFDSYWRFAAERQSVFMKRVEGQPGPWTTDEVISSYRFTNVYRASDRVSQYLIKNVLYDGKQTSEEIFFRCMLFKIFNRIETWETLRAQFGPILRKTFNAERYSQVLDAEMKNGQTIYSAAYIMPSPNLGHSRKHRNHLLLLDKMLKDRLPSTLEAAKSLKDVFAALRSYPSIGDFLAFQYAIDLNYSAMMDFSEMDFVVAGPGAQEGIRKCFSDTAGLDEASIIQLMTTRADEEFSRLGLKFKTLWGRKLHLIDCQNLFCEVDKYARIVHPEIKGKSGRNRIKQRFGMNTAPLAQWYPPKWGLMLPRTAAIKANSIDSIRRATSNRRSAT